MPPSPPSTAPGLPAGRAGNAPAGHAFCWPDEAAAPAGLRAALRGAWTRLRDPVAVPRRAAGVTRRPRLRLGELLRTRPLPLAIGLVVGLGPLAWAVSEVGGWSPRESDLPAVAAPPTPVPHGAPQGVPQWGEPLPAFRQLLGSGDGAAEPALPPPGPRRGVGKVVLASEYFAGRPASSAEGSGTARDAAAGPAVTAEDALAQAARPASDGDRQPSRLAQSAPLLGLSTVLALDDDPAGDPDGSRPWTLAQAVDRALAGNADVREARARREAFRPTGPAPRTDRWRADARREGSDDRALADGGQAGSDPARALPFAAEMVWQAATGDLAVDVAQAYLQALQARVVMLLASEHERQLRHLLRLAGERPTRDAATLASRSRLRLQAAESRARLGDARVVFEASRDRLAARVGDTPQALLLELPPAWRAPAQLQAAIDDARHFNREGLAARSEVATLAVAAWRASRADRGTAGATGWRYDDAGPVWRRVPVRLMAGAAAQRDPAVATGQRIQRDLQDAYAALQALGERLPALRDGLGLQRRTVIVARSRWLAGERPVDELLEAYRRLHDQRSAFVALLFAEARLHVRIAELSGRPLPGAAGVAARP